LASNAPCYLYFILLLRLPSTGWHIIQHERGFPASVCALRHKRGMSNVFCVASMQSVPDKHHNAIHQAAVIADVACGVAPPMQHLPGHVWIAPLVLC
jgi:hypothetical protein